MKKKKHPRQPHDPSTVGEVTTYGGKLRFVAARLPGATLRKSAWSAYCDHLRAEGKR